MAWGLSGLSLPLTMSSIKGPAPAPESFPRAEKLKIGIVHARWNKEVIDALVTGTLESLEKAGVKAEQVAIDSVPGSWELPMGTLKMIKRENVDAVVSIGCVIKGSTMHFEYICDNSLKGLMRVSLDTQVPVILGVLTALDEDLKGPSAVAFVHGDFVATAKALRDFAKANPLLVIKSGIFEGKALTADEVNTYASLESREVLLAKAAGMMKATMGKAAATIDALREKLETADAA